MGRKRKHPKHKQTRAKWYQREDDWGNFCFDWTLGLEGETWREIFAILILIMATVIILGFFGVAGAMGTTAVAWARNVFGPVVAYIFAIVFFYFGFTLLIPPQKYRLSKFIGMALLVLSLPIFFHLFIPAEESLLAAQAGKGGGALGNLLSTPLRNSVGLFPTFLVSVALVIIAFFLIFNFSISAYLQNDDRKEDDDEDKSKVKVVQQGTRVSVFEAVRRKFSRGRSKPEIITATPVMEIANRGLMPPRPDLAWEYPPIDILKDSDEIASSGNINKNVENIQKTLKNFGVNINMGDVNIGPTVTQYTLKPEEGVKLNNIVARQNDLALALSAKSLRVEAPIPGKNLVGIEIPNKIAAKVTLKEVLTAPQFKAIKSKLTLPLGRDVAGEPVAIDLEKMPHILIAGATGSGKSICINSFIVALLFNNSPADLKIMLVDPKRVELTGYNGIPHLLTPVVTEVDKTISALKWAVHEMERRYELFSHLGRRNITAYNAQPGVEGKLPYIIIIIDELADLMATSAKEVEGSIVRLAQMARATGIHLVVATQRPSVDVLTGLIKANIPSRVAFATASQVDSRTILDVSGAEKLLGRGDMLFMGSGVDRLRRVQGCFISDPEIEELNNFLRSKSEPQYDDSVLQFKPAKGGLVSGDGTAEDDLYDEAINIVTQAGKASASLLQRRLRVGYARAARLLDILEENGVIGPADGARPRDVLVSSGEGFDHQGFNVPNDDFGGNQERY